MPVLIETLWNVKWGSGGFGGIGGLMVLIETLWNVKQKDGAYFKATDRY